MKKLKGQATPAQIKLLWSLHYQLAEAGADDDAAIAKTNALQAKNFQMGKDGASRAITHFLEIVKVSA